MDSKTTREQIENLDEYIEQAVALNPNEIDVSIFANDMRDLARAKLALVQTLEIQERMEESANRGKR
jgi:hypothetical protein